MYILGAQQNKITGSCLKILFYFHFKLCLQAFKTIFNAYLFKKYLAQLRAQFYPSMHFIFMLLSVCWCLCLFHGWLSVCTHAAYSACIHMGKHTLQIQLLFLSSWKHQTWNPQGMLNLLHQFHSACLRLEPHVEKTWCSWVYHLSRIHFLKAAL